MVSMINHKKKYCSCYLKEQDYIKHNAMTLQVLGKNKKLHYQHVSTIKKQMINSWSWNKHAKFKKVVCNGFHGQALHKVITNACCCIAIFSHSCCFFH